MFRSRCSPAVVIPTLPDSVFPAVFRIRCVLFCFPKSRPAISSTSWLWFLYCVPRARLRATERVEGAGGRTARDEAVGSGGKRGWGGWMQTTADNRRGETDVPCSPWWGWRRWSRWRRRGWAQAVGGSRGRVRDHDPIAVGVEDHAPVDIARRPLVPARADIDVAFGAEGVEVGFCFTHWW